MLRENLKGSQRIKDAYCLKRNNNTLTFSTKSMKERKRYNDIFREVKEITANL